MTTAPAATQSLIRHYLDQMVSGLKGIDDTQRRDILAEINSHLGERIAELDRPAMPARWNMHSRVLGIPHNWRLSLSRRRGPDSAFAAMHHELPFVAPLALPAQVRVLFGYAATLGGLIVIVMKPFVPRVGLGSWGMVWGVPPSVAPGRELLGPYFVPATTVLSFVLACATLLLRRMTKKIPFFAKWPSA